MNEEIQREILSIERSIVEIRSNRSDSRVQLLSYGSDAYDVIKNNTDTSRKNDFDPLLSSVSILRVDPS